jgi:hypothetical protein
MTEEERDHEKTLAKIKARSDAFNRSPFGFTLWDISTTVVNALAFIAVLFILAQ